MRTILLALAGAAFLGGLLPKRLRLVLAGRAVGRTLLGSRIYFSNSALGAKLFS